MLRSDAPKKNPTKAPELETNSNKPERSARLTAENDKSLNDTRILLNIALKGQIKVN